MKMITIDGTKTCAVVSVVVAGRTLVIADLVESYLGANIVEALGVAESYLRLAESTCDDKECGDTGCVSYRFGLRQEVIALRWAAVNGGLREFVTGPVVA